MVTFLTIGERQELGDYAAAQDKSISGACHELIARGLQADETDT
ncbi:hypothetical protein [Aliiruegeria haliotis]|nr:hypothetical protein [Aliiruegeria haliotis]